MRLEELHMNPTNKKFTKLENIMDKKVMDHMELLEQVRNIVIKSFGDTYGTQNNVGYFTSDYLTGRRKHPQPPKWFMDLDRTSMFMSGNNLFDHATGEPDGTVTCHIYNPPTLDDLTALKDAFMIKGMEVEIRIVPSWYYPLWTIGINIKLVKVMSK